jgi:hypothetical protein
MRRAFSLSEKSSIYVQSTAINNLALKFARESVQPDKSKFALPYRRPYLHKHSFYDIFLYKYAWRRYE